MTRMSAETASQLIRNIGKSSSCFPSVEGGWRIQVWDVAGPRTFTSLSEVRAYVDAQNAEIAKPATTKQQVINTIGVMLDKARAAFDHNDLPALRTYSAEAYDLLNAARTLNNKKIIKQARDAYYGVTGMEDYIATSV